MCVTSVRNAPGALLVCFFFLIAVPSKSQAIAPAITNITIAASGPNLVIMSDIGATNQIQSVVDLSQSSWEVLTNLLVTQSPYLFVDTISEPGPQRYYRVVAFSNTNTQTSPVNMALITAGTFEMGDAFSEGASYEVPVHEVYVSAFYMEKYEVTKALWDQVIEWNGGNGYTYDNPGSGKGPNHPVQSINWYDMVKWCNARSEMEGRTPAYYTDPALTHIYKTGQVAPYVNWNAGYRLPTEAEWEKADRGGACGHRFPWSDVDTISHSQANYYSDPSYSYDVSPTRGFNPAFNDGSCLIPARWALSLPMGTASMTPPVMCGNGAGIGRATTRPIHKPIRAGPTPAPPELGAVAIGTSMPSIVARPTGTEILPITLLPISGFVALYRHPKGAGRPGTTRCVPRHHYKRVG